MVKEAQKVVPGSTNQITCINLPGQFGDQLILARQWNTNRLIQKLMRPYFNDDFFRDDVYSNPSLKVKKIVRRDRKSRGSTEKGLK